MSELGDAGEALRLFLRSRTAVTALAGTRISVALSSSEPSIRYTVAGGRAAYAEHNPLMLVECWGRGSAPDDGTAGKLGREVAEAVELMRGSWGGCWVAGASVESGPTDSPDATTSRPRALVTVRLQTYPLAAAAGQ